MVKTVTVDASAATSWLFPSQATKAADAFLTSREPRRLIAPSVFAWEVGNQILRRARHGRLPLSIMLQDLRILEVDILPPPSGEAVLTSIETALASGLSLFDNAYLQLCAAERAALASRDADLLHAAHLAGVETFDLRDPSS
ncbi:hypothetical protein ASG17_09315 [Brevundimonas sp. Leaf363]|uniref:type II toxin-antitoxin system VapC family toxin n=1 Tax=Brevundimonas sp. Leaf363 TaxID=1736353 RepID=UPI0006F32FB6|nr:type II toxin-antitoxin system VapC family toxin [Brevundimonas sp. Leaf363]KQS56206.1 hypothetical protein ASG17_09315 [Brevundimonas sp. Leaf363]